MYEGENLTDSEEFQKDIATPVESIYLTEPPKPKIHPRRAIQKMREEEEITIFVRESLAKLVQTLHEDYNLGKETARFIVSEEAKK
jgi:hypothetical protein